MNLTNKQNILKKDVLTTAEVCEYAGISKSFLYKLTSRREISFSRPTGKLLFFRKEDIDQFLLRNRFEAITTLNVNLPVLRGGWND